MRPEAEEQAGKIADYYQKYISHQAVVAAGLSGGHAVKWTHPGSYAAEIIDCELGYAEESFKEMEKNRETVKGVLGEIQTERSRQIAIEGWSPDHDDQRHQEGDLGRAGAAYALKSAGVRTAKKHWPWGDEGWKPKSKREDLIRAAALIVAEIERLDRNKEEEYS